MTWGKKRMSESKVKQSCGVSRLAMAKHDQQRKKCAVISIQKKSLLIFITSQSILLCFHTIHCYFCLFEMTRIFWEKCWIPGVWVEKTNLLCKKILR